MTTAKIKQVISGDSVRNAGNDYIENTTNNVFNDGSWRCRTPMCELNRSAIENEFYFIERFGFDAPESVRRQIIALKELFDFTDLHIKILKRSGALTIKKGQPVSLHSDWIGVIASFLLVILSALVVFTYSIIAAVQGSNLIFQAVFIASLVSVYILFCRDLHRLTIKPAKILRENGIKFGDKFTLEEMTVGNA